MAELTDRQKSLLRLTNQLSQSLITERINLPGVDIDIDIGGATTTPPADNRPEVCPPTTPTNLREVLLTLVNEQVDVTTPYGVVSGTLIAVKDDYIVIIEASGARVLVRIEKIELVSEL